MTWMDKAGSRLCAAGLAMLVLAAALAAKPSVAANGERVDLPEVGRGEPGSFERLVHQRRSVRDFGQGELDLEQVSRLLFAAQGITRQERYRTVPSAGALYPLEVFLAAGEVRGLEAGIYKYRPQGHALIRLAGGDIRRQLARRAYGQMWIAEAQAVMVISAVYERVTGKYGQRGRRYVHIEAGCAAQNVSLEGFRQGVGSTVVGAFSDSRVASVLEAKDEEEPLIIMPLGLLP